jgi:hypothetical protein
MRAVRFAAISAALLVGSGFETQATSGNELLGLCKAQETSPTYYSDSSQCLGYIVGVADAMLDLSQSMPPPGFVCIPGNVTVQQTVDIAVRYIDEHPQQRHLRGAQLVWGAIKVAFPCSQ